MAELQHEVDAAHAAGSRMLRLKETKEGMRVFHHPLRFKVSVTRLTI